MPTSSNRPVWRGHSCPRPLTLVLLLIFVAVAATQAFAQEKPVALKGGKLLTIPHGTVDNGVLILPGDKIIPVGSADSVSIPANAQIVDATGMTIYPGLIDSETQLGLTEISAEAMTNDLVEMSDEIMPHMHVYDAFHAESVLIPVARLNGITNAIVAPQSSDTLPGQDSFIQLAGANATEMLLIRDNAMPLNFTGDQRRNRGGFEKHKFPSTRMGLAAQLRQAFIDAQDYQTKWADYERKKSEAAKSSPEKEKKPGDKAAQTTKEKKSGPTPPKPDLKLEAPAPYLERKKPIA